MAILFLPRFFLNLISLAILAAAAYALWSWYDGYLVRDTLGVLHLERAPWRLWTGVGLLAWSFLGGRVLPLLLARPDVRRTKPERGEGRTMAATGGGALYYETHGPQTAPPIIFTHGWGMDSTFWFYAKKDLSERFRLILWDLPGLGKSKAKGKESISLDAYARDLATLVDTVGGRPVLVGHSIGGMTIQTLLRNHPDAQSRLAGLVLLDTSYTNPLKTMVLSKLWLALQKPVLEPVMKLVIRLSPLVWLSKWQSYLSGSAQLGQRLGYGRYVTRSQLAHTTLLATRASPAVLARGDLAMLNWDATGALEDLRIPALVIGGDKDIVTKLEANRTIASESPRARLEVIEGVNHMGPMERADLYNALISAFASEVQPVASSDVVRPQPGPVPDASRPGLMNPDGDVQNPAGPGLAPTPAGPLH